MANVQNLAVKSAKLKARGKGVPFKKGFDERRWVNGRGIKTPEQREGDAIVRAVIWDELSREYDTNTQKPVESEKTVDTLRLMVRSWIKKRPDSVVERIAGKVTEKVEHSGDETIKLIVEYAKPKDNPTDPA